MLDIGPAVLIIVAARLNTGRITGIELRSSRDHSGNSRDVTIRNASIAAVSDHIDIDLLTTSKPPRH